jgi:proteasome assembly chaperone (PAC2) family protein
LAENDSVIEEHTHVELRDPVLIAAFRGWNDAGEAASFAASHLGRVWLAEQIASIDPEEFYDFQAVRPNVRLVEGMTREITWPTNEFFAAKLEGSARDAIILVGTEPNTRWRTFVSLILDQARKHEVSLVLTLGALLADVPHSRPVPITGSAVDQELIERLGLVRSRYEGPTGIVGVLHDTFAKAGISSASLWAAVPHYLAVTPNPKAALALVGQATKLIGADADVSALEAASTEYEQRVTELVASDDDVEAYVKLLEERSDDRAREMIDPLAMPTGEDLAAELERFLEERESE